MNIHDIGILTLALVLFAMLCYALDYLGMKHEERRAKMTPEQRDQEDDARGGW